jgi:chemotaxis protein CheD
MATAAPQTRSPLATAEMLSVDMAELRVSSRLTDCLVVYGLGACIGLCVYDPTLRIAGIAHIVLPQQRVLDRGHVNDNKIQRSGKFVDQAIPLLLDDLKREGAELAVLRAAMVGGARIFGGLRPGTGALSGLEIGDRNVEAVRRALESARIPLCATDVGGSYGRTVVLRVSDGAVIVKPIGGEASVLTILSKFCPDGEVEK